MNPTQSNNLKVIWIVLGTFSLIVSSLFFFQSDGQLRWETATETFYTLHDIYRSRGMVRYLEEKRTLRNKVARAIESNSQEASVALNIATYLFPELLPSSNFEKDVAETLWAPFAEAIEKEPRTPESRRMFEELRANIWNYENPNRIYPTLSPYAKQAIRIYDVLSSP